jgi:hypothetical protein
MGNLTKNEMDQFDIYLLFFDRMAKKPVAVYAPDCIIE